ncbi:MAG: hypothetical protein ABIR30_02715 [Chitinophagaceae bacterium]
MNKRYTIGLRLKNIDQLFLDTASPFYGKRMLTPETEEFIIEEAKAIPYNTVLEIKLHIPDAAGREDEITNAIHRHFFYCKAKSKGRLKQALHLGWRSLLVAIISLGLLVALILTVLPRLPEGGLSITIREVLIILGWVALWRPADLLLYEWRPFKREMNLFERLAQSKVIISVL